MRLLLLFCMMMAGFCSQGQDLKSGGKLKPAQANMDIRHYTIALDVDPVNQFISGYTEIDLQLIKAANIILFDFWNGLTIQQLWVDGKSSPYVHSKDDLVTISLPRQHAAGKVKVKIAYSGKPGIATRPPWTGGFQWSKDSQGNPWIALTCQGEGGKIFFPCKDHPSDEPNEGADMIITVPKGLTATAPGLLQGSSTKGNKTTWHWKTNYTISNYCLVFNVGKYKLAQRTYTTVLGNKVPMEYYVLEENFDKAEKLLDLFEQSSRIHEKYFGEYPWVKERIAASETPHLGMEHQTNIAYGNKYAYVKVGDKDFDWLLHHEYGHEWWANKVTNKDWAHMWIQEGICVFGDAMATRELAGEEAYLSRMQETARRTQNRLPIVQGDEIDSDQTYQPDIYGKGAFFMHTLRYVMGDSLFFPTLKKLATDPAYTYDNTVTTRDVEKLFSSSYGKSLDPLFKLYLYSTNKVEVHLKQISDTSYEVKLLNVDMDLPFEMLTDKGIRQVTLNTTAIVVKSSTPLQIDPKTFYLKKVIME
ncbi:MAG: M1 family peptidase [Chitinophagaceae bacterium]|nr:MAG: M1 family peptidase [Chitinophagaceae bacterium]